MPRGWLLAPVIGAGTEESPIRAAVADRESVEGDRLEFVIGSRDFCLVGYEVSDPSNFGDHGGQLLLDEDELDASPTQVREASRLDQLSRDLKTPTRNLSAREVMRVAGKVLSPTFDERLHLGSERAPQPGSFLDDDIDYTNGNELASESGGVWVATTNHPGGHSDGVILNGRVYVDDTGTFAFGYYAAADPASAEYDIASTWRRVGDAEGTDFGYIGGRFAVSTLTGYMAYIVDDGRILNRKYVAGSATDLGIHNTTTNTDGTDYTLGQQIRDATKKVFFQGSEVLSSTDNAITAAGKVAISAFRGSSTAGYHLDSITATDAGGGAALTLELDDGISITDAPASAVTIPITDEASGADATAKGTVHPAADAATVADAVAFSVGKVIDEAPVATDLAATAKTFDRTVAETVSLLDQLTKAITAVQADTPLVTDDATPTLTPGGLTETIGDDAAVSDAISLVVGLAIGSSITIGDDADRAAAYGRIPADGLTLTDDAVAEVAPSRVAGIGGRDVPQIRREATGTMAPPGRGGMRGRLRSEP